MEGKGGREGERKGERKGEREGGGKGRKSRGRGEDIDGEGEGGRGEWREGTRLISVFSDVIRDIITYHKDRSSEIQASKDNSPV